MINIQSETLISRAEARRLPWMRGRAGRPISYETFHRWAKRGLRGIVLETIRLGGTVYTSREATQRFIQRLNQQTSSSHIPAQLSSSGAVIAADRILDQAGI